MEVDGDLIGGVPFVEKLSDEVIMSLLTLIGQIYFDIFKLPIATIFIKYKESSMQADMSEVNDRFYPSDNGRYELFESLFSFIKYCEDDLGNGGGVGRGDIRASYGLLYQHFPLLRSPGCTGDPYLAQRERDLLSCLFTDNSEENSDHWLAFLAPPRGDDPPDIYLGALVQSCYDKLNHYGLTDQEARVVANIAPAREDCDLLSCAGAGSAPDPATAPFPSPFLPAASPSSSASTAPAPAAATSIVPFPPRGGDNLRRREAAVCQQQRYHQHPCFFLSPSEAQANACINLHINTLIHYPAVTERLGSEVTLKADCEHALIWLNLYEKVSALINMILDDIGYNVFPVDNSLLGDAESLPEDIYPLHFSDHAALHRHVACGTLVVHGDEAVNDVTRRYLAGVRDGAVGTTTSELAKRWATNRECWEQLEAPFEGSESLGNGVNRGGEEGQSAGDSMLWKQKKCPLFINTLDGLPEENSSSKARSEDGDCPNPEVAQVSSAEVGMLMLFAKLSSLIKTSENILQAFLIVYKPIERQLRGEGLASQPAPQRATSTDNKSRKKNKECEESMVAHRVVGLYESRCLLYSLLLRVYSKGSKPYRHAHSLAVLSALRGMEVSSVLQPGEEGEESAADMHTWGAGESGRACEEEESAGGTVEGNFRAAAEKLLTAPCSRDIYPAPARLTSGLVPPSGEEGPAEELLDDAAVHLSPAATSYFLPHMYAKLLYQQHQDLELSGVGLSTTERARHRHSRVPLVALRYLYHAERAVQRATKADKLQKKYRAPVVAELQRVRLSLCSRLLHTLQLSPGGALGGADAALLAVLSHPLLLEGPRPLSSIASSSSSSSIHDVEMEKESGATCSDSRHASNSRTVRICSSCNTPYEVTHPHNTLYASSLLHLAGDVSSSSRWHHRQATSRDPRWLCENICGGCRPELATAFCAEVEGRANEQDTQSRSQEPESQIHWNNRIWEVIVNSMQSLLHCKIYDPFDFRSVVVLTQFVFGLSKVASSSTLGWAQPSADSVRQLKSSLGIELTSTWCSKFMSSRILDKKRTQIVGIWVQEGSAFPFEQVSESPIDDIISEQVAV
jgi:hypothetical protein